jgi:hypothetical protein
MEALPRHYESGDSAESATQRRAARSLRATLTDES